ncbi:EamA family transporter [Micropruina sonneratiae]|uniref:EamA family transporter n=1 Tax=Micropruina sonneratiae TaxID=2986940 RepID=UPI002226F27B|nr:DMT family transporter [Micropruina sp. KQZ13P-5]MCW3158666.1 DMT family transporter [Micropruina sp. KQZ13P-5]
MAELAVAAELRGSSAMVGWTAAIASACAFATSGAFAKPLLAAGWSAGAVVAVRLGLAALVLLGPGLVALQGRWGLLAAHWRPLLGYGIFGGALAQVGFFNAVQYVPVALGLLLEYLGIVLVVLWVALRNRRLPGRLTLAGVVIAIAGLVIVLDPGGMAGLDWRGVGWGLLAAFGLASYFVISAQPTRLPPLTFVSVGLGIGTAAIVVAGLVGLMPLHATAADVTFVGLTLPWWVPLVELALVAAALAYALGFIGVQYLGSTVASFVGLTEVLFAVGWAWLLLAELPGPLQLVGGVVLLAGVAAVQRGQAADAT